MKRLLLLVGFLEIAAVAIAATPPPEQPFESRDWPATLSKAPSTGVTLGVLRIQFEQTTLDQVRRQALQGKVAHQGDAGNSIYWLCYTNKREHIAERIWLISNGEMGGRGHAVTSVIVSRVKLAAPTTDCPALPATMRPASFDSNAWLGSSDRALENAFGSPSHLKESWRSYDFQTKVQGSCDGGFDRMNWLLTKSQNGKVISIYAGQVTSC
jgi:hypothetical protein